MGLLVLARKLGETLVCGEGPNQIIIKVVDIRHDKVRLGISAPKDVPVNRLEVHEAIQREKRSAGIDGAVGLVEHSGGSLSGSQDRRGDGASDSESEGSRPDAKAGR